MTARWITADVFDGLATLDDGSVDLCVTSPPFLALRSYLPADHPDKAKEIGSEATPAEFLDVMLAVTAELRRVLAPHGSIAIELGDTYAGSGGGGGDYYDEGLRAGQPKFKQSRSGWHRSGQAEGERKGQRYRQDGYVAESDSPNGGPGWPLAKSKTLIPELYRIALAYGTNPLTGAESPAGRWRIRNVVTWARPNPPVGCVDDQTEALTPDGWTKHEDLSDGDLIAAYDPATDSCRFLPAKFVRWQRDEELVAIEKRKTSQRLTVDHRCLVRTRKRPEPHVVLAGDLTNSHQTLLAAGLDDVSGPEPVTVERAELLGWFIAEGTPKYRQARIVQSLSANPDKVDRIRALLDADGADYTESRYVRRRPDTISGGDVLVTWTIKGELAEWLNLHHKRLPADYATTWPLRTLEALFGGLIGGDGHYRKGGGVLFHQQDQAVADAVQIIAIRLGRRASVTWQPSLNLWQVTVGAPEHYEAQRWTKVRKWDDEGIPRTPYSGVVWCPQVETTFWLARRDGRTFVTGNSLGDKWRPATSDVVVACTSDKRYWDDIATRRPHTAPNAGPLRSRAQGGVPGSGTDIGTVWESGERMELNPSGAPLLDYWEIPPGGYSGKTLTVHREPCGPHDGGERITSPDCPTHGDRPDLPPTAPHDGREGTARNHTQHTDGYHEPALPLDSESTDATPDRSGSAPPPTTERSDLECSPAAKPRSKASNKKAPAPATTPPDTSSAETTPHTGGKSTSPESDEHHPGTSESSISVADSTDTPTSQTRGRIADTHTAEPASEACSCSYSKVVKEEYTSHYAVFPPALVEPLIKAMAPPKVCRTCGEPSRRIVESQSFYLDGQRTKGGRLSQLGMEGKPSLGHRNSTTTRITDLGFTDCGHDDWRPALILDCFAGSGTTLSVATGHGHDAVGIDLDSRNADLARDRIGPFLFDETPAVPPKEKT